MYCTHDNVCICSQILQTLKDTNDSRRMLCIFGEQGGGNWDKWLSTGKLSPYVSDMRQMSLLGLPFTIAGHSLAEPYPCECTSNRFCTAARYLQVQQMAERQSCISHFTFKPFHGGVNSLENKCRG